MLNLYNWKVATHKWYEYSPENILFQSWLSNEALAKINNHPENDNETENETETETENDNENENKSENENKNENLGGENKSKNGNGNEKKKGKGRKKLIIHEDNYFGLNEGGLFLANSKTDIQNHDIEEFRKKFKSGNNRTRIHFLRSNFPAHLGIETSVTVNIGDEDLVVVDDDGDKGDSVNENDNDNDNNVANADTSIKKDSHKQDDSTDAEANTDDENSDRALIGTGDVNINIEMNELKKDS